MNSRFGEIKFPDPRSGPAFAPVAVGGVLSRRQLLEAYSIGLFPWYSEGEPVQWWCPDPRFVLYPQFFHIPKSLQREQRKPKWRVTIDHDFPAVIHHCAEVERVHEEGTWITSETQQSYIDLHERGLAHSVECWLDGTLVGGLYGISLGRVFFGESMFYLVPNASKVAFVTFAQWLFGYGFAMIDCQVPTEHLLRFGAVLVPRDLFLDQLQEALMSPTLVGKWRIKHGDITNG